MPTSHLQAQRKAADKDGCATFSYQTRNQGILTGPGSRRKRRESECSMTAHHSGNCGSDGDAEWSCRTCLQHETRVYYRELYSMSICPTPADRPFLRSHLFQRHSTLSSHPPPNHTRTQPSFSLGPRLEYAAEAWESFSREIAVGGLRLRSPHELDCRYAVSDPKEYLQPFLRPLIVFECFCVK